MLDHYTHLTYFLCAMQVSAFYVPMLPVTAETEGFVTHDFQGSVGDLYVELLITLLVT